MLRKVIVYIDVDTVIPMHRPCELIGPLLLRSF